ncbi:hypothetical protein BD410DRAFT_716086 [Rickenella mellea]|uniref:Pentatricopeptide repeat-containing protein-mitochondrial domain-containing protein n=1 Tax=Rickenella mellea TaxID=50990 RepID=A0A4Y7QG74_9AGAM|nr:hypothetical protein BD410DRAFT_716086 [Rickenella mellea]
MQYDRASRLSHYNHRLQTAAELGRSIDALRLCSDMKRQNIRPDIETYNCLILTLAKAGVHQEAWAAYNDMKLLNISPNRETFNSLILACRNLPTYALFYTLGLMDIHHIQPDATTYGHIISHYTLGKNLEVGLQYLAVMNIENVVPSLKTADHVIFLCADFGNARLAVDLAESFENNSVRRLNGELWAKVLHSCTMAFYVEGMEICWNRLVNDMGVTPDEGLCIGVLHTAARFGRPELAANALQQLEALGAEIREWHMEPLLEAFAANGQVKEAFKALELLRTAGMEIRSDMTSPITTIIQRDPDAVDTAWTVLDELRSEGENVDIIAVNVVIEAAVYLNDMGRAIGTYKSLADMQVVPNAETYNLLLEGCVRSKHRDLGIKLLMEMKEKEIKPTVETYTQLIRLCLTQVTYEDAFFYLEEMKGLGLQPTYSIYDSLVRKLVETGDTRYRLAVEELEQMGYKVTPRLRDFINSGGESSVDTTHEETKPMQES